MRGFFNHEGVISLEAEGGIDIKRNGGFNGPFPSVLSVSGGCFLMLNSLFINKNVTYRAPCPSKFRAAVTMWSAAGTSPCPFIVMVGTKKGASKKG